MEEPEGSGSHSVDGELREWMIGYAETFTPIKSHFPIYSKRKSSVLGESFLTGQRPASLRVHFEIGDEDARVAKRDVVGEGLYGRLQTENERTRTDIGLSDNESIVRVVAANDNPVTVGASVQQMEKAAFSNVFPRVCDGTVTKRSRYYPSQWAKPLLK